MRLWEDYRLPIFVTENGSAFHDETGFVPVGVVGGGRGRAAASGTGAELQPQRSSIPDTHDPLLPRPNR